MTPQDVLTQARAVGLMLSPNGDRLKVRGPQEALDAWRETLREYKPAIMALLAKEAAREAAEVAWRVEVLVARIPREGPIWPPVVRPGDARLDTPGCCSLCGDELPVERLLSPWRRCAACVAALHKALRLIREGVPATAPTAASAPAAAGERQGAA